MAVIDLAKRVLTLHILYFGPRQSGCGTNVRQLHRAQPPQQPPHPAAAASSSSSSPQLSPEGWRAALAAAVGPAVPSTELNAALAKLADYLGDEASAGV